MTWPWARSPREPDPALIEAQERAARVVERAEKVGEALDERRHSNHFAEGLGFRPAGQTRGV